ncbi:MAG TPA: hypothetical protein DCR94_03715 [Firmicutes bacterium]|nr:hypothetical protein [Bacillota bacterium]
MKLTLQEKLHLTKLHVHDNVPIFKIKKKYGFDRSSLKYYCALYRKWGDKAFIKPQRKEYTREMKLEA